MTLIARPTMSGFAFAIGYSRWGSHHRTPSAETAKSRHSVQIGGRSSWRWREPPGTPALPEQDESAEAEDERNVRVEAPQVECGTAGFEEAAREVVPDNHLVGVEEGESEDEDDRPHGKRYQVTNDPIPHLRLGARGRAGEDRPTGDHEEHGHGPGVDRLGEVTEPPGIAAFLTAADVHTAGVADHDGESGEDAHDVDVMAVGLLRLSFGSGRIVGSRRRGEAFAGGGGVVDSGGGRIERRVNEEGPDLSIGALFVSIVSPRWLRWSSGRPGRSVHPARG